MASVAPLASDVWDPISQYLEPLDILALWMTGSRLLRQKIGPGGGLKALRVESSCYLPVFVSWPGWWLSDLKGLTVLHLNPLNPKCLLPRLKPSADDLKGLPRGLLDLELGFVEAIYDELLVHLPPLLTRFWLPYNTQISHQGLAKLPKSLHSLNLERNQIITEVKLLPPSLTEFVGNSVSLLAQDATFQDLPRNISRLKLVAPERTSQILSLATISSLPHFESLVDLNLSIPPSYQEIFSDLSFPPQLMKLKLYGDGCALPPQFLSKLPPTLTVLCMRPEVSSNLMWLDEHIPQLPVGLKQLDFLPRNVQISSDCHTQLTLACLASLPPTLTKFRITYVLPPVDWVIGQGALQRTMDEHLQFLPASLKVLRLCVRHRGKTAEPGDFSALPPYLEQLFTLRCRIGSDTSPFVPKTLQRLSINGSRPLPVPGALYLYPREPQEPEMALNWATSCGLFQNASHLHLTTFNTQFIDHLSSHLVYLDLICHPIRDSHISALPRTLTFLRLDDSPQGLSDACLPFLPQSLRELHLPRNVSILGNVHPFPQRLHTLQLGPCTAKSYNLLLPPFLTSLELHSPFVSNQTLLSLPSSLTHLFVTNSQLISGSLLQHLPDALLTFSAPGFSFKDADVAQLPRGLRTFVSVGGGKQLTDASAGHWPPILNTLTLSGEKFSLVGLAQLPRTLSLLQLQDAKFDASHHEQLLEIFGPRLRRFRIGDHR
jgi:hypothetical protein